MGGNVEQWNDAVINGSSRGMRGGSWNAIDVKGLSSSARNHYDPSNGYYYIGFRVASVPEPTSVVLAIFAGGVLLVRRKR